MYLCPTCFAISAFEAWECLRMNSKEGVVFAVFGSQQSVLALAEPGYTFVSVLKILEGKTSGQYGSHK